MWWTLLWNKINIISLNSCSTMKVWIYMTLFQCTLLFQSEKVLVVFVTMWVSNKIIPTNEITEKKTRKTIFKLNKKTFVSNYVYNIGFFIIQWFFFCVYGHYVFLNISMLVLPTSSEGKDINRINWQTITSNLATIE